MMASPGFSSPNQLQEPRHQHVAPPPKKKKLDTHRVKHTHRWTNQHKKNIYTAVCNSKIIIELTSLNLIESFPRKIWGKHKLPDNPPDPTATVTARSLAASCASLVQARQCRNNAWVSPEECPNDIKQSTNQPTSWCFKVTFLGWLSDPFKGLSDLQLGDEKGTLNHLADHPVIWKILGFLSSSFSRKILPIIIGYSPKMWYKVGLDSSVRVVGPITPFIGVKGNPELPIV